MDSLEKFKAKYEEVLSCLLEGRMLTDLNAADAKALKKIASDEAFEAVPDLKAPFDTYQKWHHKRETPMGPAERLGARVLNSMGRICLHKFYPASTRKKPKKVKKPNAAEKYMAWIGHNDTVPSDSVLSFFLDISPQYLRDARSDAEKLGYEFEMVDGGMWRVASRPLPKIEDLTDKEKDRLLRKVILMEDLSARDRVEILRKII